MKVWAKKYPFMLLSGYLKVFIKQNPHPFMGWGLKIIRGYNLRPYLSKKGPKNLTAAHRGSTVQAFIASTASDCNMSTSATSWRIALHALRSCLYLVH
jgi:hypothetical protein